MDDRTRSQPYAQRMLRAFGDCASCCASRHKADTKAPQQQTERRYQSTDQHNRALHCPNGINGFDYGKKVLTQPCLMCDKPVEVGERPYASAP